MRAIILLGCTFVLLWPVHAAASLIQPDIGAGWGVPSTSVVAAKLGRDDAVRKGRGGAEAIAAKPLIHHTTKYQAKQANARSDRWQSGKFGPGKDMIFSDTRRKGLSLVGQIQLLSPPVGPFSTQSSWNFGVVQVIAAVVVAILGLTTIGLLAGRQPARYRSCKRGPYTRPAHSPHARRLLRESCPPPLC